MFVDSVEFHCHRIGDWLAGCGFDVHKLSRGVDLKEYVVTTWCQAHIDSAVGQAELSLESQKLALQFFGDINCLDCSGGYVDAAINLIASLLGMYGSGKEAVTDCGDAKVVLCFDVTLEDDGRMLDVVEKINLIFF